MKNYTSVGDFKEGLCKVEFEGRWGFIDLRGVEVIPCRYLSVMDFEDGIANVETEDDFYNIDFNGKIIDINPNDSILETINPLHDIPDEFENISSVSHRYETIIGLGDGLCEVSKDSKYGNSYGFININGEEVIPCIYDFVGEFSEGLCDILYTDEDGDALFGFFDVTGIKQIDFIYEDTSGFSEGLAGVKLNKKWGFIDKYNNVIIDFIFDDAEYFSEGKALVKKDDESFFINIKGEKLF